MRFAIIRKADPQTEQGCMPSDALLKAMGEYNQALADAGILRGGEGLHPSSEGLRIRFDKGVPTVTNGPFAETRELIAGFTVIEVDSKEQAIEWASQWPRLDAEGGAELELRQLYEMEDFEPGEGLQLHADLEERMARQPASACPYLFFPGTCREAFEFYADCLGGRIEAMMTHAEAPPGVVPEGVPPESVMHACLEVGRWTLMGSDCPPEMYDRPQGFSVQIAINNAARAEQAFSRLAQGGEVRMAFGETFWAHRFGMLVDRFGTPWMINCDLEC